MKPCSYRTVVDTETVSCTNHKDIHHTGLLSVEVCKKCPYSAVLNESGIVTARAEAKIVVQNQKPCSGCPDPHTTIVPAKGHTTTAVSKPRTGTIRREPYTTRSIIMNPIDKPRDYDWAVVMTTAPRTEPTIEQSIKSVKEAGWNPIIFAEPDSIHVPGIRYVANEVKLGAWFNWVQSVKWALKNTIAQYIMTVQDDTLFHPDSKSFAESVMWPSSNTGFLSLYTASHYSRDLSGNLKPFGVNKLKTTALWGACALVFPRSVLVDLLNHPVATNWLGIAPKEMTASERANFNTRREHSPASIQNVDSAIGRVLNALHKDMYVVDPSPVSHIAVYSSIHHTSNTGKRNCGRCADHSVPLEQQVFPSGSAVKVKSGVNTAMRAAIEAEIGYTIECDTCLEFFRTLDTNKYNDIQDLVLQVFANAPFPHWWRKKHVGRTRRLQRIEEIIKPLIST